MGVFDQAARFAARADPEPVLRRVLAPTGMAVGFREWLDTRALPLPGGSDRTADLVARLDDPAAPALPWLLILEFQAQHVPDKLDVLLEEAGVMRNHARHGAERKGKYRVLTVLVYLVGRCPDGVLDMTTPGGFGTRYAPLVWNVAEDNAAAALEAVAAGEASWGLLFWVPLMAGGGEDAVISRWKEVVVAVVLGLQTRGNLGAIVLQFAELAGSKLIWDRGLEGWEMTESEVVNGWLSQGKVTEARLILTRLLRRRFGDALLGDVLETINGQPGLPLLEDWIEAAATAPTLGDFIAVLRR